jgi:hypothetical protein
MAGKRRSMKRRRSARRGGLGGYNYCRNDATGAYSKSFTGMCSRGNKRYECTKEITNFIDDNIANDKTGNCKNRDLVQSASNVASKVGNAAAVGTLAVGTAVGNGVAQMLTGPSGGRKSTRKMRRGRGKKTRHY